MKRLLIWVLILSTISLSAQQDGRNKRGPEDRGMRMIKDLSAEEAATLKTKRMTLDLDLTENQKNKIYQIHLKNAEDRKARFAEMQKKREAGEKGKQGNQGDTYQKLNERLDKQIAHKKEMKQILDEDQFKRWERGAKRAQHKKIKSKKRSKRSRR
ncbi:MAG: hypothetical protein KJN68_11415 [Bacteroidia bacterium]|nr:hypothetical protein [Bacteroidia bacterium]NNK72531.1 hypothetical protein [Flavobacteriaceae bacterium]